MRGPSASDARVLIVGHGTAGRALAQDIEQRGAHLVGFLDDQSSDERVLGTLADANQVVTAHDVSLVYFAIPSADAETLRHFIGLLDLDRVDFAIIPRTYDILTKETVDIDDLTDVDVLDLVGRKPVKHDLIASRDFIEGKTILVTGAAGSIGSRLVKQIVGMHPRAVICVDRWENGMFFLGQELGHHADVRFHIADIKNEPLMRSIYREHHPDVVFHAAAYKHVPLMQANPIEAINNNVWGSLNLMRLAIEHDVGHFVYVSTDKAVNPVNVMGTTKRIGEMIMESLADREHRTKFTGVRFGNVIESNGSVMQIFRNQITSGQPLTVTHEDITRYFMTIDEAGQLIIQSAIIGEGSEILVLDMGEPVRIIDLARSLVRTVDPAIPITITGLRPGEKMFEELSYDPDRVDNTSNPKIFVVRDARNFDVPEFTAWLESFLERTRAYQIGPEAAVDELRARGFAIQ